MLKKLLFWGIGLASFTVSCSSGSISSSQFEDQRSVVVSSGIASGVDSGSSTIEEAGQSYLEIVNPVNCASRVIVDLENSNSLGDGTVDPAVLSDVKAAAAVLASARETAVRSLLGQNWPSIVAPDIEVLARDWSKAARAEFAISEAVDLGAFNLAISGYRELLSNSQANPGFIRASLGIGPASETDMC
jgi:hypothetical protein